MIQGTIIMTDKHQLPMLLSLAISGLTTALSIAAPFDLALLGSSSVYAQQQIAQASSSLAPELQGKPVVVEVYASWCPGCKNIAPTLSSLKQQYKNQAHFVVLDVSDRRTTQASEAKAKRLGLGRFFMANKSKTSTVAIFDPATGKILKQFQNNPKQSDYKRVLNSAIAQIKAQK